MKAPHFSAISVTRIAPQQARRIRLPDRRRGRGNPESKGGHRQFADGYAGLSQAAAELGRAIEQYKLENHRKYLSHEEMLTVIQGLGYSKPVGVRRNHSVPGSVLAD